ncbi:hypothetical protein DFP72DRAFT_854110 [Ephemerocybe angulata]|uniref:Uncharacterized protein n=1 Tax=Ephemerocybe angulata TaxID=980116 RepID=A0A8H6HIM5_9AGAR|nr:hypothetical protein DFP72DRAFT_854110 [Tulosesus angulatus]
MTSISSNKESICASRRSKHHEKRSNNSEPAVPKDLAPALPLSKEEIQAKNREKSRRSYAKRKSEIQSRRRVTRSKVRHSKSLVMKLRPEISYASWENRNNQLNAYFRDACKGAESLRFLQNLVEEYLRDREWKTIETARSVFDSLLTSVEEFVRGVLNAMGAGAPLKATMSLSAKISEVIRYFDEMEIVRLECDSPTDVPKAMESVLHSLRKIEENDIRSREWNFMH